jgi:hypothetical protein
MLHDAVAMCALSPTAERERLLASNACETHCRDNLNDAESERQNEDVNANTLGSISANRVPSSASGLLTLRIEPEASHV